MERLEKIDLCFVIVFSALLCMSIIIYRLDDAPWYPIALSIVGIVYYSISFINEN